MVLARRGDCFSDLPSQRPLAIAERLADARISQHRRRKHKKHRSLTLVVFRATDSSDPSPQLSDLDGGARLSLLYRTGESVPCARLDVRGVAGELYRIEGQGLLPCPSLASVFRWAARDLGDYPFDEGVPDD